MSAPLENGRSRPVSEQNARRAVLPIHDRAHLLRSDHERGLGRARHDESFSDTHRVEPARACSADIESGGASRTELRLDIDGVSWKTPVRSSGTEHDQV